MVVSERALARGRAAVALAAGVVLAAALATPARAEVDCFSVSEAIAAQRWSEAEAIYATLVNEPACAGHEDDLRFGLARVIEKQAVGGPRRACDALAIYARLFDEAQDPGLKAAADDGRARTSRLCLLAGENSAEPARPDDGVSAAPPRPEREGAGAIALGWSLVGVGAITLAISANGFVENDAACTDFDNEFACDDAEAWQLGIIAGGALAIAGFAVALGGHSRLGRSGAAIREWHEKYGEARGSGRRRVRLLPVVHRTGGGVVMGFDS